MMNEKELSVVLRELARGQKVGLCDQWYSSWGDDMDVDGLLDMYVRGHDFCVENDYPSLSFIREHFDIQDLHRHHIFIDEEVDIQDAENGYYIFLGSSKARIVVNGFKAVSIYCRHESVVDVEACGGARVFVTRYEQSGGKCSYDSLSMVKEYHSQL